MAWNATNRASSHIVSCRLQPCAACRPSAATPNAYWSRLMAAMQAQANHA